MNVDADKPVKTAKPRRRWFRFRLRTLLVMVTVLSVSLGWVGWELDQRRRERPAIAWVEKMGGQVDFRDESDGPPWENTTDKWFGGRVILVSLYHTQVSDVSPLAELKSLEFLNLNFTQVSDLSPLAEMKNLEWLKLKHTQVSDEQLLELRQALPNCNIFHTSRFEK